MKALIGSAAIALAMALSACSDDNQPTEAVDSTPAPAAATDTLPAPVPEPAPLTNESSSGPVTGYWVIPSKSESAPLKKHHHKKKKKAKAGCHCKYSHDKA